MRFPRDPWQFVRPHVQQHVLEVGALPAVPREGAGGRDRGRAPRGSLIWVRTFFRYVTRGLRGPTYLSGAPVGDV